LTQVQLAALVTPPIHPATLGAAERGLLTDAMARRLADALGVPLEEIRPEVRP
jgi:hypothetical protein